MPSTWREKYANVLAKLFRKSRCDLEDVLELFKTTCDHLQQREYKIDTSMALILALQKQISVYDAHFVVLAEQLDTYLVTEDVEIIKKCSPRALSMKKFLNLPSK